jgi:hypothetical protein
LLLADVSPDFITLDAPAGKIAHLLVKELRRAFADFDQQAHDGIAMRAGHPLD